MAATSGSQLFRDPEPVLESKQKHVLVIGAGLVGLASALWLQKFGHQVTIVDRDPPLPGASCAPPDPREVTGFLLDLRRTIGCSRLLSAPASGQWGHCCIASGIRALGCLPKDQRVKQPDGEVVALENLVQ